MQTEPPGAPAEPRPEGSPVAPRGLPAEPEGFGLSCATWVYRPSVAAISVRSAARAAAARSRAADTGVAAETGSRTSR